MTTALPAPCDTAFAAAENGRAAERSGRVLVATVLASSLASIDGSVVNVALPAIGLGLSAEPADLQWVISAYLLPLSSLLLLGGAAGDRFGRRRVLVWGVAVFAAASLACGLASTLTMLLVARALQGAAAAMLMPNSLAILGNAFEGEARGRAIGTWAAAGAIAGAIGPPLGGWLVEAADWRAIFLVNLPLAAAAIGIALTSVPKDEADCQPLDVPGAVLFTAALAALTWGLTAASGSGATGPMWIGLAVGLTSLAAFLLVERRRGATAMMPLTLFGSRPFVGLSILTGLLYGALGGLLVLLPFLLIVAGGYSPFEAGLALLPFPIVIGLSSRTIGRLTMRLGPRRPLSAGPMTSAAGFGLLAFADPSSGYILGILPGILVIAIGMSGAVAPLTTAVLASVDARHAGTASGFNSAVARTGGLIATVLTGAVLSQQGADLVAAFRIAALVGAVMAFTAGLVALAALPADSARKG